MLISALGNYRATVQKCLPAFFLHYLDGDAYTEKTLQRKVSDVAVVAHVLDVFEKDMRVAMTLTGVHRMADMTAD